MQTSSPFGADTQKYWDQRYFLFSRFDEGIQLDREGLYSAKPESIASDIARSLPGSCVLDGFCGVGGSAIGFARYKKSVISIDNNKGKLEMARHNAKIYGVEDKIRFIHADIKDILASGELSFDSLFFDPPWGGPDYSKEKIFNLDMFSPDGRDLIDAARRTKRPFALVVPKNFNMNQIYSLGIPFSVQWNKADQSNLFATIYFEAVDSLQDKEKRTHGEGVLR